MLYLQCSAQHKHFVWIKNSAKYNIELLTAVPRCATLLILSWAGRWIGGCLGVIIGLNSAGWSMSWGLAVLSNNLWLLHACESNTDLPCTEYKLFKTLKMSAAQSSPASSNNA